MKKGISHELTPKVVVNTHHEFHRQPLRRLTAGGMTNVLHVEIWELRLRWLVGPLGSFGMRMFFTDMLCRV